MGLGASRRVPSPMRAVVTRKRAACYRAWMRSWLTGCPPVHLRTWREYSQAALLTVDAGGLAASRLLSTVRRNPGL
ncbi:hypothetical protein GCM10014713_01910 [Streptomyces purpureus]|uniref:Uncharacterized protein n=1 Tax=Streptomyces purpureus TaxID=1951 RepID=A0A918GXJ7_9ACTN|nr:hypothetical protein GCM10014713_01910 [Streptomyces purpureus]